MTWDGGDLALAAFRRRGEWADGARLDRGHGQPYLQPEFARAIRDLRKTVEGRPREGWAAAVSVDDWITFKISKSGGRQLVCRVVSVTHFPDFSDMLQACGPAACLPDCAAVDAALEVYHSFRNRCGVVYSELARRHGVVAIGVQPLSNTALATHASACSGAALPRAPRTPRRRPAAVELGSAAWVPGRTVQGAPGFAAAVAPGKDGAALQIRRRWRWGVLRPRLDGGVSFAPVRVPFALVLPAHALQKKKGCQTGRGAGGHGDEACRVPCLCLTATWKLPAVPAAHVCVCVCASVSHDLHAARSEPRASPRVPQTEHSASTRPVASQMTLIGVDLRSCPLSATLNFASSGFGGSQDSFELCRKRDSSACACQSPRGAHVVLADACLSCAASIVSAARALYSCLLRMSACVDFLLIGPDILALSCRSQLDCSHPASLPAPAEEIDGSLGGYGGHGCVLGWRTIATSARDRAGRRGRAPTAAIRHSPLRVPSRAAVWGGRHRQSAGAAATLANRRSRASSALVPPPGPHILSFL